MVTVKDGERAAPLRACALHQADDAGQRAPLPAQEAPHQLLGHGAPVAPPSEPTRVSRPSAQRRT